jgi:Domain of unknown function (DUF4259)
MGAWGMGSFENDDALDFVGVLAGGGGPEVIVEALQSVASAGVTAPITAPTAARAVAAAEMVAAGRGKACDGLPADAGAWLGKNTMAAASMRDLAARAVQRIAEASDLRTIWEKGHPSDAKAWIDGVLELGRRLS